jgi:hypothetical protein
MNNSPLSPEEKALLILEGRKRGLSLSTDASRWLPHKPTLRQKLFLDLDCEEAFYGGAAGGGKSDALMMAALQHVDVPGYSALLLRRTYADLILPEALMDRARLWLQKTEAKWIEKEKTWLFPSGARLTFGYLESENDKYRYQGSAYQFIGFDELTQFTDTQYLYLFSRLRRLSGVDVPLRMRSASNPGGIGAEWVKSRFIPDDFLPPDAELPQVFTKRDVGPEGEEVSRAFVPARVDDNPYLDQESYKRSLDKLDKVTREQLLYGDWTITATGTLRFDAAAIGRFTPQKGVDGELFVDTDVHGREQIFFQARDNGHLSIWRKPQPNRLYIIGADAAQGKDTNKGEGTRDADYSVAQIRDQETGEQVARFRGRITERAFGEYLYLLCRWYNNAYLVLAVTGGHGRSTLDKVVERGYPYSRIYHRRDENKISSIEYDELGYIETTVTRPMMIGWLDSAINERSITTYDPVTINEYLAFEIDKDGKCQARRGMHDDCVTADCLSVVGIRRGPERPAPPNIRTVPDPYSAPKTYGQTARERASAAFNPNQPAGPSGPDQATLDRWRSKM